MRWILPAVVAVHILLPVAAARADGPRVVASIQPVHSLVAGLMAGVGEPGLIVKGASSPHTFSLRPSDAKAIADADLIVWVGEGLERPIADAIGALAPGRKVIELMDLQGMRLRKGHHHHDHDEAPATGKEAGHDGHDHGDTDPHVWLDPNNAAVALAAVADALAAIDPKHAGAYKANLQKMTGRVRALDEELKTRLKPVADRPFVVFHDGYGYFTDRYDLGPATAVTISPERKPGARRVAEVRAMVAEKGIACIFSEPQFSPAILQTITQGTKIRSGVLDPLGASLKPGPEQYFQLMRNLAGSLASCVNGGNS